MKSLAITDHGVMYGVIDFYKAAKEVGIKPILGCEVYVAPGSRFDKQPGESEGRYYHLVLLAENNTGYKNLMKINSVVYTSLLVHICICRNNICYLCLYRQSYYNMALHHQSYYHHKIKTLADDFHHHNLLPKFAEMYNKILSLRYFLPN